jgi:NaMN:DMB phosphoribosyltransferase
VGAVSWVDISLSFLSILITLAIMHVASTTYWHMVVARCVIDERPTPGLEREQYRRIAHASRVLLPGEQLILHRRADEGGQS